MRGSIPPRYRIGRRRVRAPIAAGTPLLPHASNTYLCNNTTYTVGYVMDHAGETVRLLEPSTPREGGPTGVDVTLEKDMSGVPRVFVHWPSTLAGEHLDRGAQVMQAIIGAQLWAFDAPTRGDSAMADFSD